MSHGLPARVLHFRKQLVGSPVAASVPGIQIRHPVLPEEASVWLALRDRAMADQRPAVRPWEPADFQREMVDKPWWRAERSWVAVADTPSATQSVVGAVTLALREGVAQEMPVVHWLLVDPEWRRRGVGRLLMSYLEIAAWDDGWREVQLETHSGWVDAVAFYQSIGYAPVRERSPR